MNMDMKTTLTKPSDRELVFTRVFDAPRELMFEVWTDPMHLEQWWGPYGFRTESIAMDLREGGGWQLAMHAPDGRLFNNRTVYLEVVAPERLVYRHEGDGGKVGFESTTTFEDIGEGRTRLTMRQLFPSAEALNFVVKTYGADKGGMQTLERLGEHVGRIPKTHRTVELVRVFDAPREDIWRAWTDAEVLREWWGPRGFTNPVCEVDARSGGRMQIVMRAPDGSEYPMRCVFREVVAPQRLVFTNVPVDAAGHPLMAGQTTVEFEEEDNGKTRMTLSTSMTGMTEQAARMLDGMNAGWSQSLDKLEELAMATMKRG
jgi:uncharacterized protein YndB with AHSA1/START domain